MKLDDVAKLFVPFGYTIEEVRDRLSFGESVFNTFEGLKLELEINWEDADKTEEMEECYQRIKNIYLRSAIRESDVQREKKVKRKRMIDNLYKQWARDSKDKLNQMLDNLESRRVEDPETDRFLKELENG